MAVEARHLNLFPSQLIGNREIINPIEGNRNICNTQMGGYGVPLSGTTTHTLLPTVYSSVVTESSLPLKTAMKSDSGITYNLPMTVSGKRSRDSTNPFLSYPVSKTPKNSSSFSFLGEDISLQIQQQQFDIDLLISQHMEMVRVEIEERRKRQARRIMETIEEGVMKRLRAKEEEIEKIGKLNWALEERIKSLYIENQIWRDLAQSNEATANALRTNLEQVLTQVKDDQRTRIPGLEEALMEDAQSCCGSSGKEEMEGEIEGRRTLDESGGERNGVKDKNGIMGSGGGGDSNRWCRNCGKEEACVLLLPCRHLCLCTVCGSTNHTCPICKCAKNASLHVNMF